MPHFAFHAIDKHGKEIHGHIDADSMQDASNKIKAKGAYPTKIWHQTPKSGERMLGKAVKTAYIELSVHSSQSISPRELTAFTRQFATLLNSGLPLIRSLHVLYEQQKPGSFKNILKNLANDVEAGSSFSEALSRYPKVFNKLYVSMIKAGEVGGILDSILMRLADFAEQTQMLKNKIKSAMIYPLVVIFMACVVVGVLMVVVIPKFKDIFSELGTKLPTPTIILLNVSQFFQYKWWVILTFIILLIMLGKNMMKSKVIKRQIDQILLRLPIFGSLTQKVNVARFSRTLGTLITSGVPILQALEIVRDTCTNVMFEEAVTDVYNSIREGESISGPLSKNKVFPPIVVNMIDVGEETASLDTMLQKIADITDAEIDISITNITKLLEPALIVVMAFVVGYIVIAMFLPLISLMNALSA